MVIDRLPGATNVLRFPIEERGRPTLELMRMLSPDVRTLDLLAEGYGLESRHQISGIVSMPKRRRTLLIISTPNRGRSAASSSVYCWMRWL